MRAGRLFTGLVAAVMVTALAPVPSAAAHGDGPLRSGTIVGGGYLIPMALAPGWVPPCSLTVDCAAWVATDCDPRLTGRDPGVFSSIVDIGEFAGTKRALWRSSSPIREWSSYGEVELWSEDCDYLGPASGTHRTAFGHNPVRFRVPSGAHWMSVTSGAPNLHWELW